MPYNALPAYDIKDAVRKIQTDLNRYGFTDEDGMNLDVDGIWGLKSMQAMNKLEAYRRTHPVSYQRAVQAYGPARDRIRRRYKSRANVLRPISMFLAEPENMLFVSNVQQLLDDDLEGILAIFGMHYKPANPDIPDDPSADIWYSTKSGVQHLFGYRNSFNLMNALLGFRIKTRTVFFQFEKLWYRFDVWWGLYSMNTLVPGAESGLYYSDKRYNRGFKAVSGKKQVGMEVQLWKKTGELVLRASSAEIEPDGVTYWQFASKPSAGHIGVNEMYMKGILTSPNKGFLEALAAAGSAGIVFETPKLYKSGEYALWYSVDTN